tara:strand:+ start:180 stop:1151 length:972 start_codon:yes stop_codon:yes gene_type:complete
MKSSNNLTKKTWPLNFYKFNKKSFPLLIALLSVGFLSCSSVSNNTEFISDTDLDMAAEIMGSSIADQQSGLMNSIYDALSNISETGISYGKDQMFPFKRDKKDRGGRGFEKSFSHTYDSTNGVHTLSFERSFEKGLFSSSISTLQKIRYSDLEGNFIARPKLRRNAINQVYLHSTKSGTNSNPRKSSEFTKIDSLNFSGLHVTQNLLQMHGSHRGFGSGSAVLRDSSNHSRSFVVQVDFEDITIDKDTLVTYGNLENAVSGTLSYSMIINKVINEVPEETVIEGTIDLVEDGTALMKFYKYNRIYRLGLKDGDIKERDRKGSK